MNTIGEIMSAAFMYVRAKSERIAVIVVTLRNACNRELVLLIELVLLDDATADEVITFI